LYSLGKNIDRRGDFLYPSKDAKIIIKMPNIRKIHHIAIEEIAEAMMIILNYCFGASKDGLLNETRKVYNFGKSGQNITTALNAAFDLLVKQNRIIIVDEKVKILQ
jgi:hypothetical protein